MAAESAHVKTRTVTVLAGLLILARVSPQPGAFRYAALIVLPFCWLDAYYLCLERRYRKLYDACVRGDVPKWELGLAPLTRPGRPPGWPTVIGTLMRPVIWVFYLAIIAAVVLAAAIPPMSK
ncbi:MAG TPA: hypothetical protein VFJ97_13395 [Dermatophilaceae bacterium]|nr:hypothetical protein [Dermatophilaceae bacterium]